MFLGANVGDVIQILDRLVLVVRFADQNVRGVPSTPLRVNSSAGFEET